ncbi:hypothetical protein [Pseudomonas huanghezhanensis]|uniref:hypothetical protein n=1 Tax=Pseudomonas huanghezhanensis TaxID=3002903 RepID=UPI0022859B2B|nr:hypothetical protein [Pseudomonas sp. BSw22131]
MHQGKDEALVCAGCLLFVPAVCTLLHKDDVVNSMLYMQLAASKKHSRFTEFDGWDDTFVRAIVAFGWKLNSDTSTLQTPASPEAVTLWDWILADLPAFMPAGAITCAQALSAACYMSAPDQPAVRLYADQVLQSVPALTKACSLPNPDDGCDAPSSTHVSMQLGFVGPDSSLFLAGVNFTSQLPLPPDFLFQPAASLQVSGSVQLTFYALQLQEKPFSRNRAQVTRALAGRRQALTRALWEAAYGQ